MKPQLFDTHCHLTWKESGDSAENQWREARESGVTSMTTIGIGLPDSLRARELSRSFEGVHATVGIHPNDLGPREELPTLLADLAAHARSGGWAGIGETGLDFYRDWCAADIQFEGLQAHLALASELGLPVVLHCRDAGKELLSELNNFNQPFSGVMHCFSDGPERLDDFLALGLHISFAGNLTYPNASPLRDAALRVPEERLLIETDAPFLAPQPVRGKRNRPSWVRHTFDALVELRKADPTELASSLYRNAETLFGCSKSAN
ncbi:MAG: TatD family hydrolase [Planctomycetes bacterium]|jgi:TatD DNase family protein|nr:TatD family hydrolase [Planctomycetota bacterium]MBT4028313.1 TatD family hydrolase [Planctomycetota bacterium]MBT4560894.1 TatD family hydrolase [Planctomycetota bacterium]MBT5119532.1 TatD family hydrolase [Planctomycetota bacterium]MBT7012509.1 TatD family hydrolase [Planctomycetota bacterium]